MIFWAFRGSRSFRWCEVHAALSGFRARLIIIIIPPTVNVGIEIYLLRPEVLFLGGIINRRESQEAVVRWDMRPLQILLSCCLIFFFFNNCFEDVLIIKETASTLFFKRRIRILIRKIRISRAASSPVRQCEIQHTTRCQLVAVPLVHLTARVIADAAAPSGLEVHIFIFHLCRRPAPADMYHGRWRRPGELHVDIPTWWKATLLMPLPLGLIKLRKVVRVIPWHVHWSRSTRRLIVKDPIGNARDFMRGLKFCLLLNIFFLLNIGRQGYLYLSRSMIRRIRFAEILKNLRLRSWVSHGLCKLQGPILRVDLD